MNKQLATLCFLLAIVFGLNASWIQIKASVGQQLLESAWKKSLQMGKVQKAWPWADTWPTAKLDIPALGESLIVLEGVSGEAMAFGPGRIRALSDTAASGVYGIGGHRDSHLRFLSRINSKHPIYLHTADGVEKQFRVIKSFVADSSDQELMVSKSQHALVLITCYPFNALQVGGSKRFVVIAEPVTASDDPAV